MEDIVQQDTPIAFSDIVPEGAILDAVNKLGFKAPTAVQAETVPAALEGKDLIVQARTGSGKTFAFMIPMLVRLKQAIDSGKLARGTFGLVITPTRELASQINEVISSISSDVKPACLIGGQSVGAQIQALREDCRIVVGTPGRIMDMIRQRELELRKCQMFVLDEADEMLSMGFIDDVRAILSRLPDVRQGLFVSATITPRVNMLAQSFLTEPAVVAISRPGEDLPPIEHIYYEVGSGLTDKASALCDLIEVRRPRSAMIFCNTKSDTETVEVFLRRRGFDARRINSDLPQKQRDALMNKIKNGELRFLVGTDIASRGIDIEEMDLVINYAIPEVPESYMHRAGRTGRAGRAGTAISLVGPQDFMPFTGLKRAITFELTKSDLPTEEEVVEARLAHFYELVREVRLDIRDRDLAMARKLLKELGSLDDPSEDLVEMVSKLSRFAVEHHISLETKPLEEEPPPQRRESEADYRQREQRSGGRRNDRRGGGGGGGRRFRR